MSKDITLYLSHSLLFAINVIGSKRKAEKKKTQLKKEGKIETKKKTPTKRMKLISDY